jgi:hypothetical protein
MIDEVSLFDTVEGYRHQPIAIRSARVRARLG